MAGEFCRGKGDRAGKGRSEYGFVHKLRPGEVGSTGERRIIEVDHLSKSGSPKVGIVGKSRYVKTSETVEPRAAEASVVKGRLEKISAVGEGRIAEPGIPRKSRLSKRNIAGKSCIVKSHFTRKGSSVKH